MAAVKAWSKLPYAGKPEPLTWGHCHFQLAFLACSTERSLVGTTSLAATVLVADLVADAADAYMADADA